MYFFMSAHQGLLLRCLFISNTSTKFVSEEIDALRNFTSSCREYLNIPAKSFGRSFTTDDFNSSLSSTFLNCNKSSTLQL